MSDWDRVDRKMVTAYFSISKADQSKVLQAVKLHTIVDGVIHEVAYFRQVDGTFLREENKSRSINNNQFDIESPSILNDPAPNAKTDPRAYSIVDLSGEILMSCTDGPLVYKRDIRGNSAYALDDTARIHLVKDVAEAMNREKATAQSLKQAMELFEEGSKPDAKPSIQPLQTSDTLKR